MERGRTERTQEQEKPGEETGRIAKIIIINVTVTLK